MPDRFLRWEDSGLPPDSPGTVVTVGTFDGVHLGHQGVLHRIARRAEETRLHSVLVTFDPHPLEVVNPAAAPPLLTVGHEKTEVVAESGVRYLAIVPFTPQLQRYTAAQFVDEVLRRRFHVRELVIGYDHGFGRDREGDADVLRTLGRERGFGVEVLGAVNLDESHAISSSMIRRAVAGGDLQRAAKALGRLYAVSGFVLAGEGRGRTLGYPTINVAVPSPRKLLPPQGVYAVRVQTPQGPFGGMMNLGPRPTFGDPATSVEIHLFDVTADFYGAYVKAEFVTRIRDIKKFASADALAAQLRTDEEHARSALTLPAEPRNVQGSPQPLSPLP